LRIAHDEAILEIIVDFCHQLSQARRSDMPRTKTKKYCTKDVNLNCFQFAAWDVGSPFSVVRRAYQVAAARDYY